MNYFDFGRGVGVGMIVAGLVVVLSGAVQAAKEKPPTWEVKTVVWPMSAPGPGWEPFAVDHGNSYWRRQISK